MANSWNESGTTWGQNTYGTQSEIVVTLTGVQSTASVGTTLEVYNFQGWGRQRWGEASYGTDATNITVAPTGLQAQTELGDFDNAGTLVGWGRNGWGEEPYGDSFNSLVQPAGVSATSSVGSLSSTVENFVPITGVQATSALGSLTLVLPSVVTPTGIRIESNVGDFDPTQETVGLTGLGMTSAVSGIVLDALTESPTGQQATTSLGSLSIEITQILTGVSTTSSVGALVPEIGVPLTGLSTTSAVGSITPIPMTVGLEGQQLTSSVGEVIILGYLDVNIVGNTNYSDVDVVGETSYTDVTHVA